MLRILVSIAPRSYRESLALALQRHRPDSEVRISPPEVLEREVGSFEPHVIVCNDGVSREVRDLACSWVEILFIDDLHANISVDGRTETVKDVGVDDLLAVLDAAWRTVFGAEASPSRR
jgi:hypothetical protein